MHTTQDAIHSTGASIKTTELLRMLITPLEP